jgi:hypothetical protein
VKLLFVPFAILAFVLFLLVLGAIGLGVSMLVIGAVGKLWRLISGADRGGRPRQQA